MSIFDSDGTSKFEIGKVYNNDGTVNSQIDKVYDNDGTTNHLIYQSWDGYLFNGGDISALTGGWAMTFNGGYGRFSYNTVLNTVSAAWTYMSATTNRTVDLTGFKTLSVYANYIRNEATAWAFVSKDRGVSPNNAIRRGIYKGVGTTDAGWINVDVSGLTGHYYIGVGEFSGDIPSDIYFNVVQLI